MVSVNPANSPYAGGGIFPAAPPVAGPTGSIAGANVGGTLIGAVQGSTPRLARTDRGTNVTVPYARVRAPPHPPSVCTTNSEPRGPF
jgi:hypothetical protein